MITNLKIILTLILSSFLGLMAFIDHSIINYSVMSLILILLGFHIYDMQEYKSEILNKSLIFRIRGKIKLDLKDYLILIFVVLFVAAFGLSWYSFRPLNLSRFDIITLIVFVVWGMFDWLSTANMIKDYKLYDEYIVSPEKKINKIDWIDVNNYKLSDNNKLLDIVLKKGGVITLDIENSDNISIEELIRFLDNKL